MLGRAVVRRDELKDQLRGKLRNLRREVKKRVAEARDTSRAIVRTQANPLATPGEEPPVVARMVIEIRSDGSRTIARGAVEDIATGDKVAIEAKGTTPAQLAGSLAKTLFTMPLMARQFAKRARDARRLAGSADDE